MDSAPHLVEDFQGVLQVYSDGSILRSTTLPFHDDGSPAVSPTKANLPVLCFCHGGGFCVGSRTWPNCHNCCLHLASRLGALADAPDFRLAPRALAAGGGELSRVARRSSWTMAHQLAVQMGAGSGARFCGDDAIFFGKNENKIRGSE
ncbi:hypothetical protein PVL29_009703 [Vitis rotundifolia]|uniref:Alpha/beta hydrolase fold-3 domain-containing protein n=1 Tax=Vitis rotundifolia TaxID=103349 RepID=A0AA39DTS2_VITRO|nr:hypothetical protein PVL29_009703 [Vitis rotundifolia]